MIDKFYKFAKYDVLEIFTYSLQPYIVDNVRSSLEYIVTLWNKLNEILPEKTIKLRPDGKAWINNEI